MPSHADFDEWYSASYGRVCAVLIAVAKGDNEAARDATDEAFVRALERWPRVRNMSSPVGWVITVGLNRLRRGQRRAAMERRIFLRSTPAKSTQHEPQLIWDLVSQP